MNDRCTSFKLILQCPPKNTRVANNTMRLASLSYIQSTNHSNHVRTKSSWVWMVGFKTKRTLNTSRTSPSRRFNLLSWRFWLTLRHSSIIGSRGVVFVYFCLGYPTQKASKMIWTSAHVMDSHCARIVTEWAGRGGRSKWVAHVVCYWGCLQTADFLKNGCCFKKSMMISKKMYEVSFPWERKYEKWSLWGEKWFPCKVSWWRQSLALILNDIRQKIVWAWPDFGLESSRRCRKWYIIGKF